jgi:hypothetical protein
MKKTVLAGLVTLTLLTVLGGAEPSHAGWVREWVDGEYSDADIYTDQYLAGIAEADTAIDYGVLHAKAKSLALGGAYALAAIRCLFTYDGPSGDAWICCHFMWNGYIEWLDADADVWAELTLYDETAEYTVSDLSTSLSSSFLFGLSRKKRQPERLEFMAHLDTNRTYSVVMALNAKSVTQFVIGESIVDFYNVGASFWNGLDIDKFRVETVADGVVTKGGSRTGVPARTTERLWQVQYAEADSLTFTTYNKDEDINGWHILITDFISAESQRDGDRRVDVQAWNAIIEKDEYIEFTSTQWLNEYNGQGFEDVTWYPATGALRAPAQSSVSSVEHYWNIGAPYPVPQQPGKYHHTFLVKNPNPVDTLMVTGLQFAIDTFEDTVMAGIDFPDTTIYNPITLAPGDTWSTLIDTEGLRTGDFIYFRYSAIDTISDEIVSVWGGHQIPGELVGITSPPVASSYLRQNIPNPFNPSTTIQYGIDEPSHVSLRIYNVAGQLVRTLVDEYQTPNAAGLSATWNGVDKAGQPVASGVYFYKLETDGLVHTKKMVLLK